MPPRRTRAVAVCLPKTSLSTNVNVQPPAAATKKPAGAWSSSTNAPPACEHVVNFVATVALRLTAARPRGGQVEGKGRAHLATACTACARARHIVYRLIAVPMPARAAFRPHRPGV
eukprot:scaffold126469_cov90-Phaeocystis_antarctica.AAC.9